MSTTVTIAAWPEAGRHDDILHRWLDDDVQRPTPVRAVLHSRYWRRDRAELHFDGAPELASQLSRRGIFEGDVAAEVDCVWTADGLALPVTLFFVGRGFEGGRAWRVDGQAYAKVSHGDMVGDLRRRLVPGWEADLEAGLAAAAAIDRWVDLFTSLCGLGVHVDPVHDPCEVATVRHAAMYLEAGWPSPVGCAVVYHDRLTDFDLDYAHILECHRAGVGLPEVLARSAPTPHHQPVAAVPPQKVPRAFYDQFDGGSGELLAFLDRLDDELVTHMSGLSEAAVRRLLQYATSRGNDCFIDLGPRGGLLFTDPLSSVFRVYQHMLSAACAAHLDPSPR